MIEEVEGLIKKGVSYKRLEDFGLEYRYLSRYLKKVKGERLKVKGNKDVVIEEENLKSAILNLKFKIHAFARRQLVWWRRNKRIKWLIFKSGKDKNKVYTEAEKLISSFLKDK